MRRAFLILGAVLAVIFGLLWLLGGVAVLEHWAVNAQREVQSSLAGAVRAIKTGQPGALALLLGVCFGYGVLHAVGPGHGKVLIGGYGMGRRVPFWSLSGLSLLASLAQSAVAVLFVYAGVAVLGWTRDAAQGVAEQVMVPVGTAAIGLVGLWLMLRGLRGIWRQSAAGHGHDHDHHHHDHYHDHHDHDAACGCGQCYAACAGYGGSRRRGRAMTTRITITTIIILITTITTTMMPTAAAAMRMARRLQRWNRSPVGAMRRPWWRGWRCGPAPGRCSC